VSEASQEATAAHRVFLALLMATEHGTTDGAHHKMWVIDQVVRILYGPHAYRLFRLNNPNWDEGIQP
jgi:hypothetical protein